MKLFENVGKNGFPVERRVPASRVEHVFSKYTKTEKSNGGRAGEKVGKVARRNSTGLPSLIGRRGSKLFRLARKCITPF